MYSEIVLAGEKEKTSNIKKLNLLDVINLLDVKKMNIIRFSLISIILLNSIFFPWNGT